MTELTRRHEIYSIKTALPLTILIMNVIWATGGGAINIVFERMGGVHFARIEDGIRT